MKKNKVGSWLDQRILKHGAQACAQKILLNACHFWSLVLCPPICAPLVLCPHPRLCASHHWFCAPVGLENCANSSNLISFTLECSGAQYKQKMHNWRKHCKGTKRDACAQKENLERPKIGEEPQPKHARSTAPVHTKQVRGMENPQWVEIGTGVYQYGVLVGICHVGGPAEQMHEK